MLWSVSSCHACSPGTPTFLLSSDLFQEPPLPRLSYKSLHNKRMTVSPTWFIFQIIKKTKKKYHKTLKILSEMSLRWSLMSHLIEIVLQVAESRRELLQLGTETKYLVIPIFTKPNKKKLLFVEENRSLQYSLKRITGNCDTIMTILEGVQFLFKTKPHRCLFKQRRKVKPTDTKMTK